MVPGTSDAAEFGINADHRNMTKFPDASNDDFKKISGTLRSMAQKAGTRVEDNWSSEALIKQGRQFPYLILSISLV